MSWVNDIDLQDILIPTVCLAIIVLVIKYRFNLHLADLRFWKKKTPAEAESHEDSTDPSSEGVEAHDDHEDHHDDHEHKKKFHLPEWLSYLLDFLFHALLVIASIFAVLYGAVWIAKEQVGPGTLCWLHRDSGCIKHGRHRPRPKVTPPGVPSTPRGFSVSAPSGPEWVELAREPGYMPDFDCKTSQKLRTQTVRYSCRFPSNNVADMTNCVATQTFWFQAITDEPQQVSGDWTTKPNKRCEEAVAAAIDEVYEEH